LIQLQRLYNYANYVHPRRPTYALFIEGQATQLHPY